MSSFIPDHAHARAFRDALSGFATGVTVVTIASEDGPQGVTVNSFASVSLAPPLILWCPGKFSRRHDLFASAMNFSVHVLAEDQRPLADRFTRGGDQFEGLPEAMTERGVPVIDGVLSRFDCVREALHDAGDHSLVVGRVLKVVTRPGSPLIFAQGNWGRFQPD